MATMRKLLLVLAACSGKSAPPPPKNVDAAKPVDAAVVPPDAAPYTIEEKKESFGTFIGIHKPDQPCPRLEYRPEPKTVLLGRCTDKPFAEQVEPLRDIVAYARTIYGPALEEVRLVGSADFWSYPDFARRLAQHAQKKPWIEQKQTLNAYTLAAAQAEDLAPELAVIFQRKVKLTSLEKCSAARPTAKDELGEFLRKTNIKGTAVVPLGCSMAFWEFAR